MSWLEADVFSLVLVPTLFFPNRSCLETTRRFKYVTERTEATQQRPVRDSVVPLPLLVIA